MLRRQTRKWVCREPGGSNLPTEDFIITAKSRAEAEEAAAMYNAVVLREWHSKVRCAKTPFDSARAAMAFKKPKKGHRGRDEKFEPYYCKDCTAWHVTKITPTTADFKAQLREKLKDLPRPKNPAVRGPKDKGYYPPKRKNPSGKKS